MVVAAAAVVVVVVAAVEVVAAGETVVDTEMLLYDASVIKATFRGSAICRHAHGLALLAS